MHLKKLIPIIAILILFSASISQGLAYIDMRKAVDPADQNPNDPLSSNAAVRREFFAADENKLASGQTLTNILKDPQSITTFDFVLNRQSIKDIPEITNPSQFLKNLLGLNLIQDTPTVVERVATLGYTQNKLILFKGDYVLSNLDAFIDTDISQLEQNEIAAIVATDDVATQLEGDDRITDLIASGKVKIVQVELHSVAYEAFGRLFGDNNYFRLDRTENLLKQKDLVVGLNGSV